MQPGADGLRPLARVRRGYREVGDLEAHWVDPRLQQLDPGRQIAECIPVGGVDPGHGGIRHLPGIGSQETGEDTGHVAYVEAVGPGTGVGSLAGAAIPGGAFEVSEMNWYGSGGGWNRVDYRIVSDGAVAGFIY